MTKTREKKKRIYMSAELRKLNFRKPTTHWLTEACLAKIDLEILRLEFKDDISMLSWQVFITVLSI